MVLETQDLDATTILHEHSPLKRDSRDDETATGKSMVLAMSSMDATIVHEQSLQLNDSDILHASELTDAVSPLKTRTYAHHTHQHQYDPSSTRTDNSSASSSPASVSSGQSQVFQSPSSTSQSQSQANTPSQATTPLQTPIELASFHTPLATQTTSSTLAVAPASAPPAPLEFLRPKQTHTRTSEKEDELIQILSKKKKTLLSEIGSLLTWRETLIACTNEAAEAGLLFNYREKFVSSPILPALESIAEIFRSGKRKEQQAKDLANRAAERQARVAEAVQQAVPRRPNTAPVHSTTVVAPKVTAIPKRQPDPLLYSCIPIDTPNMSPIGSPVRTAVEESVATKTDTDSKVKRIIFPEHETPISTPTPYIRPSTAPAPVSSIRSPVRVPRTGAQILKEIDESSSTAAVQDQHLPYSFIAHQESIYLDGIFSEDLDYIEPISSETMVSPPPVPQPQQHPSPIHPKPDRSYLPGGVNHSGRNTRVTQQQEQQNNQTPRVPLSAAARPYTASSISGTKNRASSPAPRSDSRHQQATSSTRPGTTTTTAGSNEHASSSATTSPLPPSTPAPLGFLARKNALLRQAEQESLEGFSGQSLDATQAECVGTEQRRLRDRYPNFTPIAAKHETQLVGQRGKDQPSTGTSTVQMKSPAPAGGGTSLSRYDSHSTPTNVVSPMRHHHQHRTTLNNITNTQHTGTHITRGKTPTKEMQIMHQLTPNTQTNKIVWS